MLKETFMNPTIYRYPLDPTGLSPDNKVVDEVHQLNTRKIRCIAPTYGGFFAESLVVKNFITNQPLVRGTDYVVGELFEFPTGRYGKEINGIIVIKNPSLTKVAITYQALGGDYSYSMDAIIAMIESLNLDERPVEWGNIVGRPPLFDPASHLHDAGDIYGFEYVVHSLERLRSAVLMGDVASHDEIYAYVDRWGDNLHLEIDAVRTALQSHEANRNNPHGVTKAQVGLGNVENYLIATQAQAEAATINTAYMTPLRTMNLVQVKAINPLNAHIADKNNPHAVTKAQVGLGNVDNFLTATAAEAAAGILNDRFVTPLQVKTAITTLAVTPLNAHIANTNNPHSVTKAQVGLGNVQNFGLSSYAQATAGADNTSYMTPQRVKEAITFIVGNTLADHMGDYSNPHQTTKAQVGLGSVQNYGIAATADAQAGTANNLYMTPLRVKEAITYQVGVSMNSHISNTSNPHSVTKAQVGLGSVQNYGIADWNAAVAGTANNLYMTPYLVRESNNYAVNTLGLYDTRFVTRDLQTNGSIHVRADLGIAYIWMNGAWRQFWPPIWQ